MQLLPSKLLEEIRRNKSFMRNSTKECLVAQLEPQNYIIAVIIRLSPAISCYQRFTSCRGRLSY